MRCLTPLLVTAALAPAAALPTPARAGGLSPTWAEIATPAAPEAFKVLQYVDTGDDANLVILDVGVASGLHSGSVLKAYRASAPTQLSGAALWVETGLLKVVDVQESVTIAEVDVQGSRLSKALFPKFSGVMAGDLVAMPRVTISRRQDLLPTSTLSYFDLFEDPQGQPTTFEMKPEGLARLRDAAKIFAEARVSLLMVEGYTDHHGTAAANQVESYQRALTVRQFLIDELGFDPKRVVAIGYGSAEPADQSLVPGYVEANRRIVLKSVPLPSQN